MKKKLMLLIVIITFISCQYENFPDHIYTVEKSRNVYNCKKNEQGNYNNIFNPFGEIKETIYTNRIDTINLTDTVTIKLIDTICNGYDYHYYKHVYDFNKNNEFDVVIKDKYKLINSKRIY